MNNFTKSIVYSGVVLAAGLIAIFAIYNNMSTSPANMMATMEPAAGEETVMEEGAAAVEETTTEAVEAVEDAVDAVEEVVSDCTMEDGTAGKLDAEGVCGTLPEAAAEAVEDAVEGAADAVEGAADAVEEAVDGETAH